MHFCRKGQNTIKLLSLRHIQFNMLHNIVVIQIILSYKADPNFEKYYYKKKN